MRIKLFKANVEDAKKIFAMQKIAFTPLLDKYGDYATNPAAENINIVASRFQSENIKSKMILQVHDELNFSVLPEEKEKVQKIVIEEMENAYHMQVPLRADCGWGSNWLEAH